MSKFQMFALTNPETTLRMARLLIFALILLISLAVPTVAFAYPLGGDTGS